MSMVPRQASDLTRQQAHVLREFGNPDDPFELTSDCIAICGVREWPTCGNLIQLGLIKRVSWEGDGEGWCYRLTDEGRDRLREIRR